jgi:two-component system sensor histidine kinase BarA
VRAATPSSPIETERAAAPASDASRPEFANAPAKSDAPGLEDIPVIDETVIGNLRAIEAEAGGGLIARVAKLYLGHGPAVIERLADAARGADRNALADAAHAVKSMSLNVGVARVAHLAATIEHAARAGTPGAFEAEIKGLRIAYDEAAIVLRDMIPPAPKEALSA